MNPTNVKLETEEDFIEILNQWLINKGYCITKPIDKSVAFNIENAKRFDNFLLYNPLLETEQLKQEKEKLELEKQEITTELSKIVNSRSWKITKPLRDFRNRNKGY